LVNKLIIIARLTNRIKYNLKYHLIYLNVTAPNIKLDQIPPKIRFPPKTRASLKPTTAVN